MTQVVNVFIASPGDVPKERLYAEQAIQLISQRTGDLLDIVLIPVYWENFLPCQTRGNDKWVQDRFTRRVRKCGIFIGILGERYGTQIDESKRISGTEDEFNAALASRDDIEILTYFRNIPQTIQSNPDVVNQVAKLQALQERLKDEHLLIHQFKTPEEFKERVVLDLFAAVLKIRTEAERREQYASFFRFGIHKNQNSPSILIAYPPIHKHVQKAVQDEHNLSIDKSRTNKYDWQERLLPNVVYEDVKCIEKIEAAVRLTDVQDISAVTIDHSKTTTHVGNKIWLCLPRNDLASKRLAKLGSRAWFAFERNSQEDRPHIVWRLPNHKKLEIHSPMQQYLEAQRRPRCSSWKTEFGCIVARDYAIISRFPEHDSSRNINTGVDYHYFIAGIRGLGTWGAGWYVDRKASELQKLAQNAEEKRIDAQVLLEVTYSNFRIVSVEDVSFRKQEYFDLQLRQQTIKSVIEEFSYY